MLSASTNLWILLLLSQLSLLYNQLALAHGPADIAKTTHSPSHKMGKRLLKHPHTPHVGRPQASAASSWDFEWSCCPPCGDKVTLRGKRNTDGISFQWFTQTCSSESSCPLYTYSGCWNVPSYASEFLVLLQHQSNGKSARLYSEYLETECALMAKAAQYSYIVLHNELCYGTNDRRLFNAGPATTECNASRTGTLYSLDIYSFSGLDSGDLTNESVCLRPGSQTLKDTNQSCEAFNSSVLTYRQLSELVSTTDVPVQTKIYWLSDERSIAKCTNHTLAFIDLYRCDSSSESSHTYYCKSSGSKILQWLDWRHVCTTRMCSSYKFKYRLSDDLQQVDLVSLDPVTELPSTMDYSESVSTNSLPSPTTTVSATEVTESQEQLLVSIIDLTDKWKDWYSVSAQDAVDGMQTLLELKYGGVDGDEVSAAVSLLTVLSDKLNVTESAEADLVIESLSDAIDSLLSDHTSWRETNLFASILEPIEQIVHKSASALDVNKNKPASHLNIATKRFNTTTNSIWTYTSDQDQVAISVPSSVLVGSKTVNQLVVTYRNVGELFGPPNIIDTFSESEAGYEMGDVTVSFALDSVPHTDRLAEPIDIYLPVNLSSKPRLNHSFPAEADLLLTASCVYWNSSQGMWMSNGCNSTLVAGQVRCQCYHLTSFAVLLQYTEYHTDPLTPEGRALTLIGQIGCAISLVSLVVTFCLFLYLDNLKTERKNIHMNLMVALALAQLTYVAGIERTSPKALCTVTAVLLHLFYTATFTWMLCEGVHLYVKIVAVFNSERKANRAIYYTIGWGAPVLIVGTTMAAVQLEGYGTSSFCWLSIEDGLIWAFVGPVCVVVLINLCIMAVVINIVIKSAKSISMTSTQQKSMALIKAGVKGVIILTPLLGTNWLFGLMALNRDTLALEFCFVILNSFQGLFIFLFHCVGSSEVRSALKQKRDQFINRSASQSQTSSGGTVGVKTLKNLFNKPKVKVGLTGAVMNNLVQGDLGPNLGGLKHLAPETDSSCDVDTDSGIISNASPCSQLSFYHFSHQSDNTSKTRHTSGTATTDLGDSEDSNASLGSLSPPNSGTRRAKSSSSGNAWTES